MNSWNYFRRHTKYTLLWCRDYRSFRNKNTYILKSHTYARTHTQILKTFRRWRCRRHRLATPPPFTILLTKLCRNACVMLSHLCDYTVFPFTFVLLLPFLPLPSSLSLPLFLAAVKWCVWISNRQNAEKRTNERQMESIIIYFVIRILYFAFIA